MKKLIKSLIGEDHYNELKLRTGHSHELIYQNNTIFNHPKLENAKITFEGENNILYFHHKNMILRNCNITFKGNNAVIYIYGLVRDYSIDMTICDNSVIYIGKESTFFNREKQYMLAAEGKNIIIGDDCMGSYNISFRTSDSHAVYDASTKKRVSMGRSVLIGDHVWIGQNTTFLKGSTVGSGAIIGANSVVAGKQLVSNVSYGGNPVREIKRDLFFTKKNTERLMPDDLSNKINGIYPSDRFLYQHDNSTRDFVKVDAMLSKTETSKAKLTYIKKHLVQKRSKNRFYIGEENTSIKKPK